MITAGIPMRNPAPLEQVGPAYAAGDLAWFRPVITRRVACRVIGYHRASASYVLEVLATAHPTYRRGERIVTSPNWVRAR